MTFERTCYKYKGVWIPGCWARVHNERDCSCPTRRNLAADQRLMEKIDRMEKRLFELESRCLADNVVAPNFTSEET